MKKIILVRYGEVLLKGLNRSFFEKKLIDNIKSSVRGYGQIRVERSQGRIYVEPLSDEYDIKAAMESIRKVFGIVSVSSAYEIKSDIDDIKRFSVSMLSEIFEMQSHKTFKVVTKRGDKHFPLNSQEISALLGEHILDSFSNLHVDVHNPSITVYVEVRESTYIYSEILHAFGGLPVGTNGKAVLMLSGGIDSPVAGWMMLKRGVEIEAVHFYSYPYTSERSKDKVIELVRILAGYCGKINLHIVPFTEIQLKIRDNCPHDENTIIMRRLMMKIAERIACEKNAQALITGESMGQVASQTIQSLAVTNEAVSMPVFRPLIGLDKNEVIEISRKIDTFETSILPYEDCCTIFVAKHPKTKPRLSDIMRSEGRIEWEELINEAIKNTEEICVGGYGL